MTLLAELSKAIWQRAAGPGGNTEEVCRDLQKRLDPLNFLYFDTKANL